MSRRRSMKLTQPAGCHDNPNQSPVSFHIRKVQSRYLKPYTKLRVIIFVTFKKMVGFLVYKQVYNERTGAKTICELMLIVNALFAESVSWLMAQLFISSTVHVC